MRPHRRQFFGTALAAGALGQASDPQAAPTDPAPDRPLFRLDRVVSTPVKIASVELLRHRDTYFVRSTSADGAVGVAVTNDRVKYLAPVLQQLVIPTSSARTPATWCA
jgi:hypothetical protein